MPRVLTTMECPLRDCGKSLPERDTRHVLVAVVPGTRKHLPPFQLESQISIVGPDYHPIAP